MRQLGPSSDQPAWTATAGTAAPAPAPAPSTHSGGEPATNSTDSARMTIRPGMMNAAPPIRAPGPPAQPPRAEDGELGGGRAGHQVADGDGVLELPGVQPAPALDAQLAQQPDVRGRPAEADAADPAPFPQHRRQRDRRHGRGKAGDAGVPGASLSGWLIAAWASAERAACPQSARNRGDSAPSGRLRRSSGPFSTGILNSRRGGRGRAPAVSLRWLSSPAQCAPGSCR